MGGAARGHPTHRRATKRWPRSSHDSQPARPLVPTAPPASPEVAGRGPRETHDLRPRVPPPPAGGHRRCACGGGGEIRSSSATATVGSPDGVKESNLKSTFCIPSSPSLAPPFCRGLSPPTAPRRVETQPYTLFLRQGARAARDGGAQRPGGWELLGGGGGTARMTRPPRPPPPCARRPTAVAAAVPTLAMRWSRRCSPPILRRGLHFAEALGDALP